MPSNIAGHDGAPASTTPCWPNTWRATGRWHSSAVHAKWARPPPAGFVQMPTSTGMTSTTGNSYSPVPGISSVGLGWTGSPRPFGAATGVRQPLEAGARRRRHRPALGCRLVRSPLVLPRRTLVQERLAIPAQGAQVVSAGLGVHPGHETLGRDLRCVPPHETSRRLERHGLWCLLSRLSEHQ